MGGSGGGLSRSQRDVLLEARRELARARSLGGRDRDADRSIQRLIDDVDRTLDEDVGQQAAPERDAGVIPRGARR